MAFERGTVYGPAQLLHRLVRFLTQTEDATWQPNTFFPKGAIIRPISGYRFVCIQEGETGSSQPNWSSIASKQGIMYKQTINDGNCIWQVLSTTFSPGWDYIINLSDYTHRRLFPSSLEFRSEVLASLSIPYPVVEFEFVYGNSVNDTVGIWYATTNNLTNFSVAMTSHNQRFEFSFHNSSNYWTYYISNIYFTSGQSYVVRVEYVGNQVKFYINGELRQTINTQSILTRPNARFIVKPFNFNSPHLDYITRIKWLKVYNQDQLLCYWNFQPWFSDFDPLFQFINFDVLSQIYMTSSDTSIDQIPIGFTQNSANNYAHLILSSPIFLLLFGKTPQDLYRPVVRIERSYSSNSYYSLNFGGTELYSYLVCNWNSDYGIPTWNVLTPTDYLIQGNNSYFQIVTRTGDATHYYYFGEYYPFYPSNLTNYIPLTQFGFQRANQSYQSSPNFNTALLTYINKTWSGRSDYTRFTNVYLVPFEGQYRPVFPIVIGTSQAPYGMYYNLFYTLGQGLSLFTYLDDGSGNDYIVFREITNNNWYQWYAIKIE